jgi:hypothetical protein
VTKDNLAAVIAQKANESVLDTNHYINHNDLRLPYNLPHLQLPLPGHLCLALVSIPNQVQQVTPTPTQQTPHLHLLARWSFLGLQLAILPSHQVCQVNRRMRLRKQRIQTHIYSQCRQSLGFLCAEVRDQSNPTKTDMILTSILDP